jgi:hypothetical protein
MAAKPSPEAWNDQVLLINQALLGSISTNFRMVSLDVEWDAFGYLWVIRFYLEEEVEEDLDEIVEEILFQYFEWQDYSLRARDEIVIGKQRLPRIRDEDLTRVVFRRRENIPNEQALKDMPDKPEKRLAWDPKTQSWKQIG